jgi:predicted transcriptional regulator YdeE
MKKELTNKSEIKLIGLTARTNNQSEMNPQTSKIGELVSHFWGKNIANQISNRKNPGVTLSVYTEYDSNEHGNYTYFIGEEVGSFDNVPPNLQKLIIPAAKYQKFSTPSGEMPEVVINAWQQISKMSADDFGGERAYIADFEVYDQRACDPTNASLDIYIGIDNDN